MDKQKRIEEHIRRLKRLFAGMSAKTKKAVQSLIENAAFMAVTLEDLQKHINEHGVTDEYQNGANQFGIKKSPQAEMYNTMIKNYSSVIKQLTDLLPKEEPKPKDDGFDEFVKQK